jgi:hypothetical protein
MVYDIENIFKIIIDRIEQGESLRSVLRSEDMPSQNTFFKWLNKSEEKVKQYARAMELRAEVRFESIEADYMEEPQRDPMTGKIDTGWVQLQRLKIDSKKWELSKLHPKKYGDKLDVTSDGDKITSNDIKIEIVKPIE